MGKIHISADWDDVEDLAESMVEAGITEGDVAAIIGRWADRILPLDVIIQAVIPGPAGALAGAVLEAKDEELFTGAARGLGRAGKLAAGAIFDLFKVDPDKRAARRARRAKRRAKRQASK